MSINIPEMLHGPKFDYDCPYFYARAKQNHFSPCTYRKAVELKARLGCQT